MTVLAKQRHALILEQVRRSGGVRVSDLTQLLSVSEMTVRRDLEALARLGLLEKVHGGATRTGIGATEEPGFDAKVGRQPEEKAAIARRAAGLIRPGSAIALSAGTTTHVLARHLADVPGLTVVTNSMRTAQALGAGDRPDRTVIVTGGIRTPSDALVGPVALATIRSLHFDVVFMGVHGMAEQTGFSTPNLMEAEVNRALIAAARSCVVLADHTKWGTVGLSSFARLDEADVLITDAGLSGEARSILAESVGELVLVTTPVASAG
jgi:DeoR/GlpR family transcriptional regulator of sugar metabolism